jgi:hypothetical protein
MAILFPLYLWGCKGIAGGLSSKRLPTPKRDHRTVSIDAAWAISFLKVLGLAFVGVR